MVRCISLGPCGKLGERLEGEAQLVDNRDVADIEEADQESDTSYDESSQAIESSFAGEDHAGGRGNLHLADRNGE